MSQRAMVLFDSHCHLTDERIAPTVDEVLDRARAAGIVGVVTIASDPDDADAAAAIASRHDDVWCTAGIHPHGAASGDAEARARIEARLEDGRVVAIGETGLDYHYDNAPRNLQRRNFSWHLELAARTGQPVIVHSREADDDTAAAVREAEGDVVGVLHCFTAGARLMEIALAAGWYISFAGLITFRNFDGADLLRAVPDDRILIETDSPYLAPVPMRGRTNEPAFVAHTCAVAAQLRDAEATVFAAQTTANARRFYRLDRTV